MPKIPPPLVLDSPYTHIGLDVHGTGRNHRPRVGTSPVQHAQVSDRAKHKADTLTTAEGDPVHSMNTLLADLTTICRNRVVLRDKPEHEFTIITEPTPHQQRAFDPLGKKPDRI